MLIRYCRNVLDFAVVHSITSYSHLVQSKCFPLFESYISAPLFVGHVSILQTLWLFPHILKPFILLESILCIVLNSLILLWYLDTITIYRLSDPILFRL